MKTIVVRIIGILVFAWIGACAPASNETKWHEDSFRVRASDGLEEIALTLPVFESRDPRATLTSGGFSVAENTNERWRLLGDAAQDPVLVERVSKQGKEPVIVRVTRGPSESGMGSRFLMKRYASGWERSEYKEWSKQR